MTTTPHQLPSYDVIEGRRADFASVLLALLDLTPTEYTGRGPGSTILALGDEAGGGTTVVIHPDQIGPLSDMLAELLPDC
ncbi:hypothetical protein ACWC5I_29100 [Kitasatospora sp. NPDC001574]